MDQAREGLLSPFLRTTRIRAVRRYLRGRVLDVGCGSGELTECVAAPDYLGVDIDEESLSLARRLHPLYRFQGHLPYGDEKFDTVVSLAVIEHVPEPGAFLGDLAERLVPGPESRVICTTPHPGVEWIHTCGASLGLFSRHASEEHDELLDHSRLAQVAGECGLRLTEYRRFLFGANQLAVFHRG